MATNITSTPIDLSNVQGFSIQAYWDNAPTGSFHLEVSNNDGATWSIYQDSVVAIPVVGDQIFWNVSEVHFDLVRLIYTATSGTGNVTVWINCKGDDNA